MDCIDLAVGRGIVEVAVDQAGDLVMARPEMKAQTCGDVVMDLVQKAVDVPVNRARERNRVRGYDKGPVSVACMITILGLCPSGREALPDTVRLVILRFPANRNIVTPSRLPVDETLLARED